MTAESAKGNPRKSWSASFGIGLIAGFVTCILICVFWQQYAPLITGWCTVTKTLVSPDLKHIAYLISYSQGSALGQHGSWVIVEPATSSVDPRISKSRVFEIDHFDGASVRGLQWTPDNKLQINYSLPNDRPCSVWQRCSEGAKSVPIITSLR